MSSSLFLIQKYLSKVFWIVAIAAVLIGGFATWEYFGSDPFQQALVIPEHRDMLKSKIDSIVVSEMNQYNIPGIAIGIVKDDTIYYTAGYGVRNIEYYEPVTEWSMFHTASVSKLFTAAAMMNLVKENRLLLDTKLVAILPEINFTDQRVGSITIKQLLNHSSGLRDVSDYHWGRRNQSDKALQTYIEGLKGTELLSDPGTAFHYSNIGYDLLGYIIQKVSKQPFEEYVKEKVLTPAGMHISDFRYYTIPDVLRTSPYSRKWMTKRLYRSVYPYTREHTPSSTLNASAKELCNWMLYFLRSCKVDSSEASYYKEMIQPSLPSNSSIGLGFQLYKLDQWKTVGHYGGDKGFRSLVLMLPEKNMGLVVLGNCDYHEDYRQEILFPIARLILAASK